jgi:hypothetical protein
MNEVRLQEGHPVDENLRPIKVGGKSTAIETAQHGDGARVNGDLEVTGSIPTVTTNSIVSTDLTIDAGGHVEFEGCAVGFDRLEGDFATSGVIGGGGSTTDIDFRLSNKYRLEMTADITVMNLIFPATSGNFLLVCTTDGDHDVTAWKVYESDESAATTTDVMWAGGSVPAFTDTGIDIVSFYWDADEQQCYGVVSLAFATP